MVVGGGVIGLTAAFRLAHAGTLVTLLDPSPGRGATWAAAGMLAPGAEAAPGESANYRLQLAARQAWEGLARDVVAVCGSTIEIHDTGTLLVGFDASDRRALEQFSDVATSFGVVVEHVRRDDRPEFFAGVTARIADGFFLAGDGWLDPDQVVAALLRANEVLGVTLVRACVLAATTDGERVEATTLDGSVQADVGILATGAGAAPEGVLARASQSVRPVRGMTLRLQGVDRSDQPTVRALVRGRSVYMVSRPGGYCVLGASSDEKSDLVVEVGDLQRMLRDALDVFPDLEAAGLLETRQGLRPASRDLSPFFEVLEGRWAWSSGHYRHGVTLAPLAAADAQRFVESFS